MKGCVVFKMTRKKTLGYFKEKKIEYKTPSIVHRVKAMENAMNTKWGYQQLHNLVNEDLRCRFKNQDKLFWEALFNNIGDIDEEGETLLRGYKALDDHAEANNAPKIQKNMVEGVLSTGEVFCIIADGVSEHRYPKEITISVSELSVILEKLGEPILNLKRELYGSRIIEIREVENEKEEISVPF